MTSSQADESQLTTVGIRYKSYGPFDRWLSVQDLCFEHKRLSEYKTDDFDILGLIISEFSEIVILPHVMAEVSNIARQIGPPARTNIQAALRQVIATCVELPVQSRHGAEREEFVVLGLADSVLLYFCAMESDGLKPTLITVDTELANTAHSLGIA